MRLTRKIRDVQWSDAKYKELRILRTKTSNGKVYLQTIMILVQFLVTPVTEQRCMRESDPTRDFRDRSRSGNQASLEINHKKIANAYLRFAASWRNPVAKGCPFLQTEGCSKQFGDVCLTDLQ